MSLIPGDAESRGGSFIVVWRPSEASSGSESPNILEVRSRIFFQSMFLFRAGRSGFTWVEGFEQELLEARREPRRAR